jgi:hypothetical protein
MASRYADLSRPTVRKAGEMCSQHASGSWPTDPCGRLDWIAAEGEGLWETIIPSRQAVSRRPEWRVPALQGFLAAGPAAMPSLMLDASVTGRRRVAETRALAAQAVAWLRDVRACTWPEIAQTGLGAPRVVQKEIKQIERLRRVGRRILAARGILPWTAWPDGGVPDGWPDAPEFRRDLAAWSSEGSRWQRRLDALSAIAQASTPVTSEAAPALLGWLRNHQLIEKASTTRDSSGALRSLWVARKRGYDLLPCFGLARRADDGLMS